MEENNPADCQKGISYGEEKTGFIVDRSDYGSGSTFSAADGRGDRTGNHNGAGRGRDSSGRSVIRSGK